MARLVVLNRAPPATDDPELDARRFQVGHVVDVLPDGAELGNDFDRLGWWTVIDVPGTPDQYADYVNPDPEWRDTIEFAANPKFPRLRVKKVDLDALGAGKRKNLANRGALQSVTRPEVGRDNPNVFGNVKTTEL